MIYIWGMWVRAIEDEIPSRPLRQRFKFRVEVNGVHGKRGFIY